MSITYRIDHHRRVVIATASGTLTEREIFDYQDEVWSQAGLSGFDELIDMSGVEGVEGPVPIAGRMQDLAGAAASHDATRGRSRLAIAAPGDLAFGLGRMYATYRSMQPGSMRVVQVFRSMNEAAEWLGLQTEPAPGDPAPEATT